MAWSYTYDPQIWPAIVTAILTAVLGWYGWQRRNFSGAKPFVFLCLFSFLWAVGCILELSATDFSNKTFWIRFQAIWQVPEATTWPWFVLAYAGLGRWLTHRNKWIMLAFPIISILLMITNNYHHLVWKDFLTGDHVIQVFGIANWIMLGYAVILVLFTVIILLWLAIRSPRLRWPAVIMSLGMVIAFGIYWVVNLDSSLLGPGERILFTMGILALTFSVALFRFRALDPVPLAYSAIFKQMQAGVLVFDLQKKVVDLNPAAGQILGSPVQSLWGHPVTEILPAELSILNWLEKPETAPSEVKLGNGSDIRHYNLQITPLRDRQDRILGHLVFLRDITEQKQSQAHLMEQQHVVATLQERERLAREFHDGIGQTLGYASLQSQIIRKLVREGRLEKVDSLLDRLVEVTQDAHADIRESILNLKAGSSQEWFFFPTLRQYLSHYQEFYGLITELSLPEGLGEDVFEPVTGAQLLRVIQEALTNARKHSGAHSIRISFETADDSVMISITDDGKGFDTGKLKSEDGRHFGLQFMQERMEQIGGSIFFDSQPGSGTVVRLKVPMRKQ
jgi:PAS domain S-box-containing protein